MIRRRFEEPNGDPSTGDPVSTPPTPAPEPTPAPSPEYATKAEVDALKGDVGAVRRVLETSATEFQQLNEKLDRMAASTTTVNAPQPPAPPQVAAQRAEAGLPPEGGNGPIPSKSRVRFRGPLGG